jgi:hypothetical protein
MYTDKQLVFDHQLVHLGDGRYIHALAKPAGDIRFLREIAQSEGANHA